MARILRLGAVVGLLVFAAAAVVALPASSGGDPDADAPISDNFHGKSDNGIYIVRLSGLPAVAYDGREQGYAATKPSAGSKLDPNNQDVGKYVDHLKAKHDAAISSVGGGQKVYDYGIAVNGFAAKLSYDQAVALASEKGIVSVEPDLVQHADTISTPKFLGLSQKGGTWDQIGGVGNAGEGLIFANVDTGVWPENPAFADLSSQGQNGPQGKGSNYVSPKDWHGTCQTGEQFTLANCNGKLIGAQYFVTGHGGPDSIIPEEFLSPRDFDGHGSHTASTAAGNNATKVTGAGVPPALQGLASGMAPKARVAIYKACWEKPDHTQVDCFTSDTLAAINKAVADGVDAINYSISGTTTSFLNSVEVAFLFAEDAGVFVAASAGNSGPGASTVAHPSPWITTAAASTHDRLFQSTITLGNAATYQGVSVTAGANSAPLILASNAGVTGADTDKLRQCFSKSANGGVAVLDPAKVAGKIVVCDRGSLPATPAPPSNARVDKPAAVQEAGGIGTIIANVNAGAGEVSDIHVAPAVHVNNTAGDAIKLYAATPGATAKFTTGVPVTVTDAPKIAGFSSRGPSLATGDQLKPDISAPGVDVLAAVAPTNHAGRMWDLESGTSMSAPHIAGLSLLIKQAHKDWTPDMIKSAMMTTAYDLKDPVVDPFAQGAGHVNPTKFLDPGLVYQSGGFAKYLGFICGVHGPSVSSACPSLTIKPNELNIPSMAIGAMAGADTLTRTVTNVTGKAERYTASVQGLTGLSVAVSPSSFTIPPGAAQDYSATFTNVSAPLATYATGSITLTGNRGHVVRIPVVVQPVKFQVQAEASGSGTSSSLTYNAKSGYAGTLTRGILGLQAPQKSDLSVIGDPGCGFDTANPDASVANGTATVTPFVGPASGSSYVRFQTYQADASSTVHDLDMFVYRATTPTSSTYNLIGVSGGPDANEFFASTSAGSRAANAKFKVYILGCGVDAPNGTFTLFAWALASTPSNAFTAKPAASETVSAGQILPETFSWSGLDAGTRYLGRVTYGDGTAALTTTLLSVSTR